MGLCKRQEIAFEKQIWGGEESIGRLEEACGGVSWKRNVE